MKVGMVEPERPLNADTLGDIEPGDLQQGQGLSTAQLGRVTVSRDDGTRERNADAAKAAGQSSFENTMDSLMGRNRSGNGSSLAVWAVVIALLILVKIVTEKNGEKGEFSSVRVGLENWFVVGALAATFIYAMKITSALIPFSNPIVTAWREFWGVA